jgi:hypothetical protein
VWLYSCERQWKIKMYYSNMHSKFCTTGTFFNGSRNYRHINLKNRHKYHKIVLKRW